MPNATSALRLQPLMRVAPFRMLRAIAVHQPARGCGDAVLPEALTPSAVGGADACDMPVKFT
ncbi:hypothetical protein Xcc3_41200 [Xanthomonas campestris pv. campestris]|nr:hypothetical protein Xcc3_41200 [Xanthomonas campestris pv. campestris]